MTSSVRPERRLGRDLAELLTLAWPVVLSRLGYMTMGLIDTLVVARFSTKELAYNSLAWVIGGSILTGGIGLVSGVQVMTARHIGEGRPEATGGVLRRGVVYGFLIGAVCGAVSMVFGQAGLAALKLDADLVNGSSRVLLILSTSLPLALAAAAASGFLEAHSRPRPGMWAVWSCNGLNLVLDLWLVPGGFGVAALGARGAAWGTMGARIVMLTWLLIYIARMKEARGWGVFAPPVDGRDCAREQRRIGYGAGLLQFIEGGAFGAMTVVAGWLGGIAVAAWSILLNLSALIFMAPLGLGVATGVLVGRAYGARDGQAVRRFGLLGFGVTGVVLTALAVAVVAFAPLIAHAYTPDPALIPAIEAGLLLCSLFFVADGLQVVAAQALRAQSDVWIPSMSHTVTYLVVMCPLAWALAVHWGWGLSGIVWAVIAASLLAAGFLMTRFWWVARRV